ncbi:MAG: alpha/beta fold hydrolase [bacterium]
MPGIFFGPEETKLHGVLRLSKNPGAPAVVICHPHPQFGGSMDNNVVYGVESAAIDAGFSTLRFNFRGVGRSRGRFDNGFGEREDVKHAVDRLAEESGVGDVVVVGYSFGAVAGLPAAMEHPKVVAMAGVSPPTVMADFGYLADCEKPKLIIAGAADSFCDPKNLESLVKNQKDRFELFEGVDHFYIGHEARVGRLVCEFISSLTR